MVLRGDEEKRKLGKEMKVASVCGWWGERDETKEWRKQTEL